VQPGLFDSGLEDLPDAPELLASLREFTWKDRPTLVEPYTCQRAGVTVPVLTNEFWTSRQRAASSLHEISYRACFKPQLPAFFIERMTRRSDVVYDPFTGRGTTVVEAALRGRVPFGCDVNPLSQILVWPRLQPPRLDEVGARLSSLDLQSTEPLPEDLLAFYHADTLREICGLRSYLLARERAGALDRIDAWIRMVAVNRLTGHSPGFFSVYTLPPNQALSAESQRKINRERQQVPPLRSVKELILRKSAGLLSEVTDHERSNLAAAFARARWRTASCAEPFGEDGSVTLVVTSPPFLDVVNYATDNWLRCWFCGVDAATVQIAMHKRVDEWQTFIGRVFVQLARLLCRGGWIAFEVGEVRGGRLRLEELVVPCGVAAQLEPVAILINDQIFTKTANIWGVDNNRRGTNTNRIVLLRKP
jgi:hypothetical protein